MNYCSPRTSSSNRLAIRLACVLLAAALGAGAPAKELKIATTSPPGSSWLRVLDAANEELRQATDGRLAMKIYASGSKGKDDTVVLRKIRLGELHGALMTAAVFQRIYPDVQIYNLPMAFRDLAEVDAVRERMDPVLIAGLGEAGFEAFGIGEVGMAYPMSTKEARTVADGRGLKVWAPAGDVAAARTLSAFGIAPISLTIGDVLPGLSSGMIDTVAAPPVAVLPLQWHTRLKYMIDLPIMYIYGMLVVDKRALRGVTEEDVAALRRIMVPAVAEANKQNRADHEKVLGVLKNQGMQFITLTPAELRDWQGFAAAASEEWVKEGVISAEIHAMLQGHLAELRGASAAATPEG